MREKKFKESQTTKTGAQRGRMASGEAGDGRKQTPGEMYRNGQRKKFGQLILRRVIRIVATRFYFSCGSAPDPAGRAYSAPPDLQAVFKGPTSKGREGSGRRVLYVLNQTLTWIDSNHLKFLVFLLIFGTDETIVFKFST